MKEIQKLLLDAKILIIDDDASIGDTLKEILIGENYTFVRYLSDSRQAIDTYKEYKPDLVLLDIKMPHVDGFQVMQQLRLIESDNGSYAPILVLTGETETDVRLRALENGAKDFLNKPFNITEALSRIHNLLEVRLLHKNLQLEKTDLEEKVLERTKQVKESLSHLNEAHSKIKDAYIETIYRLTLASEYKDSDTSAHIKRISHYCRGMGAALGLSTDEQDLLYYGSPMHDIGKIGIPDRILLKKGPLDPEEWEIMKTHTIIGGEILKGSKVPILDAARQIALSHHERFDGSGYPYGLKGDAIPLYGRIVTLVDIYDALRSKRPYKEPFTHKTALDIILNGDSRGIKPDHFDPRVMEYFKKHSDIFEKIFDENQDEEHKAA